MRRIGVLGPDPTNNPVTGPGYQVFLSELRKLGFTEGQNLVVEYRRTDEGLPEAFTGANEMVAAKADVLVANGPEIALQAATAARPKVPIVMFTAVSDPALERHALEKGADDYLVKGRVNFGELSDRLSRYLND